MKPGGKSAAALKKPSQGSLIGLMTNESPIFRMETAFPLELELLGQPYCLTSTDFK